MRVSRSRCAPRRVPHERAHVPLFSKLLPKPLLHTVIRRKMALHKTPIDRYRVFIARELPHYEDAFSLLHIAYAYQGIEAPRATTMRITPQHVLPESTVLVAYEGDTIVGTMTVTLDSPAGLPLDKDYGDALRALRERGAKIVEYGSLAVVRRCWHTGVTNLLNSAAYLWTSQVLKATQIVMGVNPGAREVYDALYAFKPLGPPKTHAELLAPVQGFSVSCADTIRHIDRYHRGLLANGTLVSETYHSPLPCVEIPRSVAPGELPRWKMSREVFRELFIKKSKHLHSLDPGVREYLTLWRSPRTLSAEATGEHPLG